MIWSGTGARCVRTPVVYLFALVASVLFVFRHFFLTSFDMISGDAGDARIMIALLEHWRAVFRSLEPWNSPIFFHPVPGVLANTDAHLLQAGFYALLRLAMDEHTAYEVGLMLTKAIGFFAMALLLRDGLKLPHWITILGAFLFTILAVNYRALGHGQFVAISYIPLMMWLSLRWLIRDRGDTVGHFAGPALAVLSGLVAFSTFYLAWFSALFSTILALLAAGYFCVAIGPMRSIKMAAEWLVARRLELAATAICGATVWSLFLRLYLPRLKEHGGYSLAEIMGRGQGVHDVVVAGPQNWLWGWPLNQDPQTWGFPPIFSVMTIAGILFGVLAMRRRQAGEEERLRARYAILLGVAGILMWVSFLNFGGWTAYAWIYEFFPGGRAMRVPLRITLFLGAVFVPVAMIGLHELMRAIRTRRHLEAAFFSILALAFLLEQGTSATPAHLSRKADRRLLRTIPPPPTDCKAFYVEWFMERRGTDPLIQYFYGPTTDAMLLAYRFRLPTLNGFLTVVPKDWNLMPPLGEDYAPKVQRWIQQHGLSKVCHLHLAQQTWSVPAE